MKGKEGLGDLFNPKTVRKHGWLMMVQNKLQLNQDLGMSCPGVGAGFDPFGKCG